VTQRVSFGPCRQCGAPVVYQGAEYCSPTCYAASVQAPAREPFTLDTETSLIKRGLLAPPLACVSWSTREERGLVHVSEARDYVVKFLNGSELLAAYNAAFDFAVFCAQWPEIIPLVFEVYNADRVSDPMLREKLRDIAEGTYEWGEDEEGGERTRLLYNLEDVAYRRCRIRLEKGTWQLKFGELIETPMSFWPVEAQEYAVLDSHAAREVWLDQERENTERGVDYFEDEFRQSRAYFWLHLMGCWGFHTNPSDVREFARKTQQNYERLRDELLASGIVKERRTKKKATGLVEISYVKKKAPVQALVVQEKLSKGQRVPLTKTAEKKIKLLEEALDYETVPARRASIERKIAKCEASITTDKDVCSRSDHPLLKKYAELSHYEHMLKSDVPLLQHGTEFPIQAKFDLANSGRTRGTIHFGKGNPQNWSTSNGMRECVMPRLGHVFAVGDFSGFELRSWSQVCLWLFGQTRMGQMLNQGLDPHLEMAAKILHISYDEAKADFVQNPKGRIYLPRQTGKVGDFGLPGGLSPPTLVDYGRRNYNVIIELDEAFRLRDFWLHAWPEAQLYLDYVKGIIRGGQKQVKYFMSNRYRGDLIFTEAANGFFQALAADAAKAAGFLIARACYAEPESVLFGSRPIMFVHDEFVLEVSDDERASDKAHELSRLMVLGASPFLPDVPPVVEPMLGRKWSKSMKAVHDSNGRLVPWDLAA
jgi:DNA polymerase family A